MRGVRIPLEKPKSITARRIDTGMVETSVSSATAAPNAETTAGPAHTTPLTDLARECDEANDAVAEAKRIHQEGYRALADALVAVRHAELRAKLADDNMKAAMGADR